MNYRKKVMTHSMQRQMCVCMNIQYNKKCPNDVRSTIYITHNTHTHSEGNSIIELPIATKRKNRPKNSNNHFRLVLIKFIHFNYHQTMCTILNATYSFEVGRRSGIGKKGGCEHILWCENHKPLVRFQWIERRAHFFLLSFFCIYST